MLAVALGVPSPGGLSWEGEAVLRGWSPEDENTVCGCHIHPSQPGQAGTDLRKAALCRAGDELMFLWVNYLCGDSLEQNKIGVRNRWDFGKRFGCELGDKSSKEQRKVA